MEAPEIKHVKIKHGRCSFCGHYGQDCTGEEFPELARLSAVMEFSQTIGEFLEWLAEDGVVLCREHRHSEGCYEDGERVCGASKGELIFDHERIEKRLARFFGIDLEKIEREKREMLAQIREGHSRREIRKELGI